MSNSNWYEPIVFPEQFNALIIGISSKISMYYKDVDAIAAMGNSSVFMAGAICYVTDLPIMIVRKNLNNTNSKKMIECSDDLDSIATTRTVNVALIDDVVYSGSTLRRVKEKIDRYNKPKYRDDYDRKHNNQIYMYNLKYLFLFGCNHNGDVEEEHKETIMVGNLPEGVKIIGMGDECYV